MFWLWHAEIEWNARLRSIFEEGSFGSHGTQSADPYGCRSLPEFVPFFNTARNAASLNLGEAPDLKYTAGGDGGAAQRRAGAVLPDWPPLSHGSLT